jgi:hypothetical protein
VARPHLEQWLQRAAVVDSQTLAVMQGLAAKGLAELCKHQEALVALAFLPLEVPVQTLHLVDLAGEEVQPPVAPEQGRVAVGEGEDLAIQEAVPLAARVKS